MRTIPNHSALKAIAHETETALTITKDLAEFTRMRGFTDIKRQKQELVRADYKIVDADANRYWRLLEQQGIGSVVSSAKGKPERFVWNFNMKEVIAIALGDNTPQTTELVLDPVSEQKEHPLSIPKLADKPVENVPRIVKQAKQNESDRIRLMSTAPLGQPKQSSSYQSINPASFANSGKIEPKIVVISIRDGMADIKVEMPADITAKEIETLSRVLSRQLA